MTTPEELRKLADMLHIDWDHPEPLSDARARALRQAADEIERLRHLTDWNHVECRAKEMVLEVERDAALAELKAARLTIEAMRKISDNFPTRFSEQFDAALADYDKLASKERV